MPNSSRNPSSLPRPAMPELTEIERLKLENLNLKRYALETQLTQVLTERANLIKVLEQARPGWHWKEPIGFVANDLNSEC